MCICLLSNAKIRWSTDSVDLLNANYASAMSPTCMQFSYSIHIISIWVHNHSVICNIQVLSQSFCIHKNWNMLTHPYAVWECFRADLVPSVCIWIHEQPLATTCIHLQPSNITCLKHMFTPISFYLKFEDSIDRIQSNDGSEYRYNKNLVPIRHGS